MLKFIFSKINTFLIRSIFSIVHVTRYTPNPSGDKETKLHFAEEHWFSCASSLRECGWILLSYS